MISPFYSHGIFSDCDSMEWLARQLEQTNGFTAANNVSYCWRDNIVKSGLNLAAEVLATKNDSKVLLIGHSQGGLVCRVAAVALVGQHLETCGTYTRKILRWQAQSKLKNCFSGELAVVTIATPNTGAMTFGQMSLAAELTARTVLEAADWSGFHNVRDLMTPRLFEEFQNWRVNARYLSISGVSVNRYSRGSVAKLTEFWPVKRVSVRFDLPNDLVVEDSSTDLRQSLIPPEIDVAELYQHVRTYPTSIQLDHFNVRESPEVVRLIKDRLRWLFPQHGLDDI